MNVLFDLTPPTRRPSSPPGGKIRQAALLAALGACIISSRALPHASCGIRARGRRRSQWSTIAKMRNYPAPSYSSTGPTRAAPGSGRGAAADGPHALRVRKLVAGLHYVVAG